MMSSTGGRIDLHMHSIHSDGEHRPEELVAMARSAGLSAIALTDHDTVAGCSELELAARGTGLETVSGVELSSSAGHTDLHILGYFVDTGNEALLARLDAFRNDRRRRVETMLDRLRELGAVVTMDDVLRHARGGALGRPHVAKALLELGYVEQFDVAFRRYLGHHAPAYVPKPRLEPDRALALIRESGGVGVLAHPGTAGRDELIPGLVEAGLAGIEVWHPKHSPSQVEQYRRLARELDIVATGGSDFHGASLGNATIGTAEVPARALVELRHRL